MTENDSSNDSSSDTTMDSDNSNDKLEDDSSGSNDEGVLPKFRWNKDMNLWEVSYDEGKTWILLEEKQDILRC